MPVPGKRSDTHFQRHDRLDLAYRGESLEEKPAVGADQNGQKELKYILNKLIVYFTWAQGQNRGIFMSRTGVKPDVSNYLYVFTK